MQRSSKVNDSQLIYISIFVICVCTDLIQLSTVGALKSQWPSINLNIYIHERRERFQRIKYFNLTFQPSALMTFEGILAGRLPFAYMIYHNRCQLIIFVEFSLGSIQTLKALSLSAHFDPKILRNQRSFQISFRGIQHKETFSAHQQESNYKRLKIEHKKWVKKFQ